MDHPSGNDAGAAASAAAASAYPAMSAPPALSVLSEAITIGVTQHSESFYFSPTAAGTRHRSNTEHRAPWEQHEGGGLATYLPPLPARGASASPAPRGHTPANSSVGVAIANNKNAVVHMAQHGGAGSLNSSPRSNGVQQQQRQPLLSGVGGDSSTYGTQSPDADAVDAEDQDVMNAGVADDHEEGDRPEGDEAGSIPSYQPPPVSHAHKLGQWMATAISGNDITSSCLYVVGLVVADAGIYAPICLLMVVFTLWLFRKVYGEAVTALPLNGGAYNVLLNTTSKSTAAIAACLTILSYVATAVVSGSEAIEYASHVWSGMPLGIGTILLLAVFALLNLMGISDSAVVALAIFLTHLVTVAILVVASAIWVGQHGLQVLRDNYWSDTQPVLWRSIIFGFSSAMLGVSGFESSANFVEEQKSGVFVKTLRNMWLAVSLINPSVTFLALCILPQQEMRESQGTVMATMGRKAAGVWLEKLVSVDAFLVLSGGVLTSFVGVTGLCRRLALDRCLPQFLLAENSWRRTNHWIILGFFGVCSSMYLILNGNVTSLSNVYSVSFMSVMALFSIGNMLLKYKRGKLKREVTSPWLQVILALLAVLLALSGLLAKDASILRVWFIYFFVTGGLVASMFFRVQTLKILYTFSKTILGRRRPRWLAAIANTIKGIGGQSIGFFAKSGRLSVLNKAILYVRSNEDCAWIRIIHVYEDPSRIPAKLLRNVHILDEIYPKIKIDLVLVPGTFSPDIIDYLSQQLEIPKNLMFITCPTEDFAHKIETLGGVRLITH